MTASSQAPVPAGVDEEVTVSATPPGARDLAGQRRGLVSRLRPLLRLLAGHRLLLVAAVFFGVLNQLLIIAVAVIGSYLVGRAITGAGVNDLIPLLLTMVALVIPRAFTPWLESLFSHILAYRVLVEIRDQVHRAFARLAPGYLLERRSGDLGATAIADIELLEVFFSHTLAPFAVAVAVPFASAVALALFHWSLPLVLVPVLALVATVPGWLQRRAETQGREVRAKAGEVAAETVDSLQGLREIVVFGQGERQLSRLGRVTGAMHRAQLAHSRRSGTERAAIDVLITIGTLAVLLVAAALVLGGAMNPPLFPAVVVLALLTFEPVTTLAHTARELNMVAAAGERVAAILDTPALVTDRVDAAPEGPVEPRVRFDKVSFRYAATLPDALREVSFEVAAGETVALVGHSGAGKSTAAHLLLRFWDVDAGAISVGGHDLRDLPQATLRGLITVVPQDTYLFHTSAADNIRLGRPTATDDDVTEAARRALADEFIAALPHGYQTVVGERGVKLSAGQRQRIALARALLRDSPILVMDEPVSNLDTQSERELTAAMRQARVGHTVIIIAHRLSTIRSADRLVVLDHGRVAETGSHDELLAAGGTYARLITGQTTNMLE